MLRSAAAAQCPAFVANICRGGVSPRRRGSASARSCCLDHVPARQQVAPCRRCRRPARRARLASRARQALGSHGKDTTSAIDSPESPTARKGRGRGPRHPSMQWHGAEICLCSGQASLSHSEERCPVETGGVAVFCCAIDGRLCCETAHHLAQQPPRPRPSVRCCPAPRKSSKHGRRGLSLLWLGSFASVC